MQRLNETFERPDGVENNEDIRFRFNEVGRELLYAEVENLHRMQEKYPWFVGETFIGSTTIGTSVNIKEHKSDVDVYYFYDSAISDKNNTPRGEVIRIIQKEATKDSHIKEAIFPRMHVLDISEKALNSYLDGLIDNINPDTPGTDLSVALQSARTLSTLFYLMPNHCLANQRLYVLNLLREYSNGQLAYELIIDRLSFCERLDKTQYVKYPKSIEEARNYFDC